MCEFLMQEKHSVHCGSILNGNTFTDYRNPFPEKNNRKAL